MPLRFLSKRSWASGLLTLTILCLAAAAARAQQTVTVPAVVVNYADMIIYNGKVVSMDDTSLKQEVGKVAQGMAIRDGKILALGTTAEIMQYAGPKTEKVDLKGRTVIPGIMDSHTHIHNNAVSDYAKKHPEILLSVSRSFNVAGKDYNELRKGIELVLKENMANAPKDQWAYINLPTGGGSGLGIGQIGRAHV